MLYTAEVNIGRSQWRHFWELLSIDNVNSLSGKEAERLEACADDIIDVVGPIEFPDGRVVTLDLLSNWGDDETIIRYYLEASIYDPEDDSYNDAENNDVELAEKIYVEYAGNTYIINIKVVPDEEEI